MAIGPQFASDVLISTRWRAEETPQNSQQSDGPFKANFLKITGKNAVWRLCLYSRCKNGKGEKGEIFQYSSWPKQKPQKKNFFTYSSCFFPATWKYCRGAYEPLIHLLELAASSVRTICAMGESDTKGKGEERTVKRSGKRSKLHPETETSTQKWGESALVWAATGNTFSSSNNLSIIIISCEVTKLEKCNLVHCDHESGKWLETQNEKVAVPNAGSRLCHMYHCGFWFTLPANPQNRRVSLALGLCATSMWQWFPH